MNTSTTPNKTLTVRIPCFDIEPAKQLSWMIRNFYCNVCESYLKGSLRRQQAYQICEEMISSAYLNAEGQYTGDITTQEHNELLVELDKIEEFIYPGCSRL